MGTINIFYGFAVKHFPEQVMELEAQVQKGKARAKISFPMNWKWSVEYSTRLGTGYDPSKYLLEDLLQYSSFSLRITNKAVYSAKIPVVNLPKEIIIELTKKHKLDVESPFVRMLFSIN